MNDGRLNIAMVAPFPPEGSTHNCLRGTASYTKNLVTSLCTETDDLQVRVFANFLHPPPLTDIPSEPDSPITSIKNTFRLHRGCEVLRCWNEDVRFPFQTFICIWRHRKEVDIVHIQHEYTQFGRSLSPLLFPLFLGLLRLIKVPIVVTLHGVVEKNALTDSFRKQHFLKIPLSLLRFGFEFINQCTGFLADRLIVHEKYFKKILMTDYHLAENKIVVIPHGIEIRSDMMKKDIARKVLGVDNRRTLLFFGHLAGYKGFDILIDAFKLLDRNDYRLFIVGGEPQYLRDNPHYVKHLIHLKQTAHQISNQIIFTGFVPEEKISLYFSATDVAIFPYPEIHASSGPFSLALSYKCPFLVSKAFAVLYGLSPELSFEPTTESLFSKVKDFFESENLRLNAMKWNEKFTNERGWSEVTKRTREIYREVYSNSFSESKPKPTL